MKTFLGLVAKDLFDNVPDFEKLTLVFPNKRAALFMAEELKSMVDKPMWMPEIVTCNDFILHSTGLTLVDELESVVMLYKIFSRQDSSLELSEFYHWGKMLLADFDDVDKYLVNAHDLFGNVDKYREMDDASLSYLSSEQIYVLKRFFNIVAKANTNETEDFQNIWNQIEGVYDEFRAHLLEQRKGYLGMIQRKFVEEELWPNVGTIAFVGFNALNECEKRVFLHYKKNGSARFYWDYDTYYTSDNPHHEAGYYMRDNLKHFPNTLGSEHFNRLSRESELKLTVIDVPNAIAQTKLLSKLLDKNAARETAVVLCDESLLIPVKNSFPNEISNINVTMGFPAKNSSVVALLECLYLLTMSENQTDSYYFKHVIKLLEHPLIYGIDRDTCANLIKEINETNQYNIPKNKICFNNVCRAIFDGDRESITHWLLSVFEAILLEPSLKNRVLDREVLFKVYTYIQRIESIFIQEKVIDQLKSSGKFYMSLINKMVSYISIPFSGQPLQGVQLMGMMETRMLDFENIILLSVNEGVMPKGGVAPSFIPVSFRRMFRMPVPEHQDAIFAYYFYRLIQRAKKAHFVYVSGNANGMGSEMSRFLLQLKYESKLSIKWLSMKNSIKSFNFEEQSVERTDAMMQRLSNMYRDPQKGKLSPSALSTYILCPLNFMRQFVEGLKETDTIEDELDARTTGNYLHSVVDVVYKELNKRSNGEEITKIMIFDLINDKEYISDVIESTYCSVMKVDSNNDNVINGLNSIGHNVVAKMLVERYLYNVLEYDAGIAPFKIIKLEEKVSMPLRLSNNTVVYIGGIVDRIDRLKDGTIRVIDYKTGQDTREYSSLSNLFEIGSSKHVKAPFQTMLYAMAYMNQSGLTDEEVVPGVYILREMADPSYDYHFVDTTKKKNLHFSPDIQNDFMNGLNKVINDMYKESGPVGVSKDDSTCKYCLFKGLCNKV